MLVWFRDKLRTDVLLAWPYLVMLGFGLLAALRGTSELAALRPLPPFYLALAIGALTLLRGPALEPVLVYGRAGLGLIVPITAAAMVYIGRFDFSAHPGQAAYLGAYVLVAAAVVGVLSSARMPHRR